MKLRKNYLSGEELDRVSTFDIDATRSGYMNVYDNPFNNYVQKAVEYTAVKVGGWIDKIFDKTGLNTLFKYVTGDEKEGFNWPEPPYVYSYAPVKV